jgi:hypothetical protein
MLIIESPTEKALLFTKSTAISSKSFSQAINPKNNVSIKPIFLKMVTNLFDINNLIFFGRLL